jgi:hypothetical protein
MSEPDYIAQVHQQSENHSDWFKARAIEAQSEGCTFARGSVHPQDARLALFEAWKEHPEDQGDIRWQLCKREA